MNEKPSSNQPLARRSPRQDRSQQKVELILEAATRLLEQHAPAAVSTNAIARLAGVSIGTLYQYFPDKDAVFQALMKQELGGLSTRILNAMQGPPPEQPGGRIAEVIRAVLDSYGGREIAHRRLMQYVLERGTSGMLAPLFTQLTASLARGVPGPAQPVVAMAQADAFVLTHAMAGVLRAAVAAEATGGPSREALERSLTRLVLSFVASAEVPAAAG